MVFSFTWSDIFAEAGYLCIPAVLPILKEVADSFAPDQAQENEEDPTTVMLGVVANIFHKIIELLVRRLRKEPEEGKEVEILTPSVLIYFFRVCTTSWVCRYLKHLQIIFYKCYTLISLKCESVRSKLPLTFNQILSIFIFEFLYVRIIHISDVIYLLKKKKNCLFFPDPAVSVRPSCPDRLPPSGSGLGHGASQWSLLDSFRCHRRGAESFASEGTCHSKDETQHLSYSNIPHVPGYDKGLERLHSWAIQLRGWWMLLLCSHF